MRVVLLGAEGAGKSLHGRELAIKYNTFHIKFRERLQELILPKTKTKIGPEYNESKDDADDEEEEQKPEKPVEEVNKQQLQTFDRNFSFVLGRRINSRRGKYQRLFTRWRIIST